jgi:hypothetical protein
MSLDIKPRPALTPTTLLDEVMSIFARGKDELFADLARSTFRPDDALAALTGTCRSGSVNTKRDTA